MKEFKTEKCPDKTACPVAIPVDGIGGEWKGIIASAVKELNLLRKRDLSNALELEVLRHLFLC